MDWQPIETVPMDGRHVDLHTGTQRICDAWFGVHDWINGAPDGTPRWGWPGYRHDQMPLVFTHWRPVPAAPGVTT